MILPASYLNGFAPRDGRPLYPSLWRGCVFAAAPCLGPTGLTLRDQSGFKNNGTLTNGPTWAASQGKYAMSFNSLSSQRVEHGITPQLEVKQITVAAWFSTTNFGTLGSGNTIIDKARTVGSAWIMSVGARGTSGYNGKLTFEAYDGTWKVVGSAATVSDGIMHHGCCTYDGATAVVYVDGQEVGRSTWSIALPYTAAGVMNIGRYVGNNDNYFSGNLDNVMAYNRALSPDEIRTLATRRGIAYEMAPRRRSSVQVTVAPLRYNLFSGSIGNTDVIGAS